MGLSGTPIDYVAAFLGGVVVSFTPCVYPLVPVTISYIGVRSAGSKIKGLGLGVVYVTGIAVTYSLLGLLASLTGKLFGTLSAHPVINIIVGAVVVLFGLSMFGLFDLPALKLAKLPVLKHQNYFSTFILGLTSGLIVGPCLTPVLGSILVYLSVEKRVFYGASLLFVFAYGMGMIFIIASVFSSALMKLPKSGKWTVYVQKAAAFILVLFGLYFIFNGIRNF